MIHSKHGGMRARGGHSTLMQVECPRCQKWGTCYYTKTRWDWFICPSCNYPYVDTRESK